MSTLDPEVRDLLAAIRDALEADGNRHLVLGILDGLIDQNAKPEAAARLLREHAREATAP